MTNDPAQAEADGIETADVEWRGLTFHVPTDADEWPVAAQVAFESDRIATGLQALLPRAEWTAFMRTSPRNRDMRNLLDTIASTLGFGSAGE